ncbi:MAG: allantoinase [Cyanobacteria bacterium RYN_339]|nr:allantoinase [Cyanobacteria bacterium RYN_339]
MSPADFVIRAPHVLLPDGPAAADIVVRGARVAAVIGLGQGPADLPIVETDALVMPGVVDTHVHLNDPGRTAWEGFETGTRAAAAGGITTLVDMPLNSIPVTTTQEAFQAKLATAEGHCWVDCGFWGGVIPGNAGELQPMIEAGILGFKAFMCHSGIDDFPASMEDTLREAMRILARSGTPLLLHAELESHAPPDDPTADKRKYHSFLASRPPEMEIAAVALAIQLCRETGCRVHVVHLAAAGALPLIAAAKAEGLPFSVETCPHYLVFAAEEIPDGATAFKCCPPIREAANRELLWQGLASGVIDFVACDHSPCTPDLKLPDAGDFLGAWGGIASVQFALPVVWTHARERGHGLADIQRWLCSRTAAFAGLADRKGAIAPGHDADLVLWRPDAPFAVAADRIHHKHPITPYLGRQLTGVVEQTYVRGQLVFDRGAFPAGPIGQPLASGRAVV